jgi:hypothetical protein
MNVQRVEVGTPERLAGSGPQQMGLFDEGLGYVNEAFR